MTSSGLASSSPTERAYRRLGAEGTFPACSFWYVEALARAGRLDEAQLAFEKVLTYANHGGLYTEQISRAGQQQGNFPRR